MLRCGARADVILALAGELDVEVVLRVVPHRAPSEIEHGSQPSSYPEEHAARP